MNCFLCASSFQRFTDLFSHFRNLHGLPSTGSEVKCTFGGCPRVFLIFQRLEDHALCKHGACNISEFVDCQQVIATQPSSNSMLLNCAQPLVQDSPNLFDTGNVNLKQSYMRFMTSLFSNQEFHKMQSRLLPRRSLA